MDFQKNIPKEFLPFASFIIEATPVFISFSIPNTPDNYHLFLQLIEPDLNPNIVEIQQLPDPRVNIFMRIFANQSIYNMEDLCNQLPDLTFPTFDPVKVAQNIINSGLNGRTEP